jgi:CheY-like chemotaxis protein
MNLKHLNILLADDDTDDCIFFKEALGELIMSTSLTTVHDGEELMRLLVNETTELPQILFLDLNMPRKNGFECLSEIKQNNKLKNLPVIIFSTSFEQEVVNLLYKNGAQYFIRKPSLFLQFKEIILHALLLILDESISHSTKENFVLTVQDNLTV